MTISVHRLRRRRPGRDDRGSMAVEVVLLTPVLMAFIVLIVMFGRYVAVRGDIDATARDAARAASLQTSRTAAEQAARDVVRASLDDDTSCSSVNLSGEWRAGGEVTVDLDCTVSFEGLGLIGVPGKASMDASSTVPLDPYRSFG
ncbi:TadE family protein [Nocardioides sp.]|uniref:TadE family protein n=1 Tax=Nocardioides sp. TaxID=35761 RepID=UPI002722C4F8|nr:TadE family protein [Nocardioides sp.]MDO9454771.1 pilus assembly protein [Nocardioides sp.]